MKVPQSRGDVGEAHLQVNVHVDPQNFPAFRSVDGDGVGVSDQTNVRKSFLLITLTSVRFRFSRRREGVDTAMSVRPFWFSFDLVCLVLDGSAERG